METETTIEIAMTSGYSPFFSRGTRFNFLIATAGTMDIARDKLLMYKWNAISFLRGRESELI